MLRTRPASGFQVLSAGAILAVALTAGDRTAVAAGAHDALDMDAQMAALAEFLPERDPSIAPPGIDADIWQALVVPEGNRPTAVRVELGHKLYLDTRLSADGTVACATCHDVSRGFADPRPLAEGIGDQLGRRNAPTTMNALLFQTQFLDGRAPSLEEQAKLPILNPIEMGQPDEKRRSAASPGTRNTAGCSSPPTAVIPTTTISPGPSPRSNGRSHRAPRTAASPRTMSRYGAGKRTSSPSTARGSFTAPTSSAARSPCPATVPSERREHASRDLSQISGAARPGRTPARHDQLVHRASDARHAARARRSEDARAGSLYLRAAQRTPLEYGKR